MVRATAIQAARFDDARRCALYLPFGVGIGLHWQRWCVVRLSASQSRNGCAGTGDGMPVGIQRGMPDAQRLLACAQEWTTSELVMARPSGADSLVA